MPLSGTGSSEPAACILHWRLNTENPPVAGALREQPKGQDRPRKIGTGANAVVRHRLFGAIPLRDASATSTRPIRDASATGTRPIRDASATAARHNRDAFVPANPEIRLASVATNNQRSNLPPANPPIPSLDYGRRLGWESPAWPWTQCPWERELAGSGTAGRSLGQRHYAELRRPVADTPGRRRCRCASGDG